MNMGIHVENSAGYVSVYTTADLNNIARRLAKSHGGKLVLWRVDVSKTGTVAVTATVEGADGWRENFSEVIDGE